LSEHDEHEMVSRLDERGRYELFTELRALQLHWPRRFAATMGARGERLLAVLEPHVRDPGRYLKLRRIALARLAGAPPRDHRLPGEKP